MNIIENLEKEQMETVSYKHLRDQETEIHLV